jgi:hypothetical protein
MSNPNQLTIKRVVYGVVILFIFAWLYHLRGDSFIRPLAILVVIGIAGLLILNGLARLIPPKKTIDEQDASVIRHRMSGLRIVITGVALFIWFFGGAICLRLIFPTISSALLSWIIVVPFMLGLVFLVNAVRVGMRQN